nr:MAK10-like protein [Tanacetum cinerariifolium]
TKILSVLLEITPKPSHEGYKNTIELPERNNVVPLRSDTIRLVQNGRSFYGLRFEDPNQHHKDFLKLVDSLDLDVANRERTRLRLFQFFIRDQASNWLERLPAGSISTWIVCVIKIVLLEFESVPLTSRFVGFFGVSVTKLTTGRLVNGSSFGEIDMVIKDLDLEPKVDAMMKDFLEMSLGVLQSFLVERIEQESEWIVFEGAVRERTFWLKPIVCVIKIVLLEFESVPLTSRFVGVTKMVLLGLKSVPLTSRFVVSEQDELPSNVELILELDEVAVGCTRDILGKRDFLNRLSAILWLATGRLVNGSSFGEIDMVIKDLNLEPKDVVRSFAVLPGRKN